MEVREHSNSPRHAFIAWVRLPGKEQRARITGAEQSALAGLEQVRMSGRKLGTAYFTGFYWSLSTGKLAQNAEGIRTREFIWIHQSAPSPRSAAVAFDGAAALPTNAFSAMNPVAGLPSSPSISSELISGAIS